MILIIFQGLISLEIVPVGNDGIGALFLIKFVDGSLQFHIVVDCKVVAEVVHVGIVGENHLVKWEAVHTVQSRNHHSFTSKTHHSLNK